MLTQEQKIDIVKYISQWSTKSIFEDVESVAAAYDELDVEYQDDKWKEVEDFLSECGDVFRVTMRKHIKE